MLRSTLMLGSFLVLGMPLVQLGLVIWHNLCGPRPPARQPPIRRRASVRVRVRAWRAFFWRRWRTTFPAPSAVRAKPRNQSRKMSDIYKVRSLFARRGRIRIGFGRMWLSAIYLWLSSPPAVARANATSARRVVSRNQTWYCRGRWCANRR
jgi:hypothetical protein